MYCTGSWAGSIHCIHFPDSHLAKCLRIKIMFSFHVSAAICPAHPLYCVTLTIVFVLHKSRSSSSCMILNYPPFIGSKHHFAETNQFQNPISFWRRNLVRFHHSSHPYQGGWHWMGLEHESTCKWLQPISLPLEPPRSSSVFCFDPSAGRSINTSAILHKADH